MMSYFLTAVGLAKHLLCPPTRYFRSGVILVSRLIFVRAAASQSHFCFESRIGNLLQIVSVISLLCISEEFTVKDTYACCRNFLHGLYLLAICGIVFRNFCYPLQALELGFAALEAEKKRLAEEKSYLEQQAHTQSRQFHMDQHKADKYSSVRTTVKKERFCTLETFHCILCSMRVGSFIKEDQPANCDF